MKTLLSEDEHWLREWLEEWHPYEFGDGISERYTWIAIVGIPLVLWNESFIQWLLADDGVLIEVDPATKYKWRLDSARVRIRTSKFTLIQRQIYCRVDSHLFPVIISEESGGSYYNDGQNNGKASQDGTFRVRPESVNDGSESDNSFVPNSVPDEPVPKDDEPVSKVDEPITNDMGNEDPLKEGEEFKSESIPKNLEKSAVGVTIGEIGSPFQDLDNDEMDLRLVSTKAYSTMAGADILLGQEFKSPISKMALMLDQSIYLSPCGNKKVGLGAANNASPLTTHLEELPPSHYSSSPYVTQKVIGYSPRKIFQHHQCSSY